LEDLDEDGSKMLQWISFKQFRNVCRGLLLPYDNKQSHVSVKIEISWPTHMTVCFSSE